MGMMRFFLTFSICILTLTNATTALANNWVTYNDEDGIFSVKTPSNYKISKKFMRFNDETLITSGELLSSIDQRPFKDIVQQYIIKYDQTISDLIPREDIGKLLAVDIKKYIDFYTPLKGILRKKQTGVFSGYPGGEVIISYSDPKLGLQNIRIRILYTSTTRIEQIALGPTDGFESAQLEGFFSFLDVEDGRTAVKGDIKKDWNTFTASSELFSVLYPRPIKPFALEKPKHWRDGSIETFKMTLKDPVYNQTVFYSVYGYQFDTILNTTNVQEVIFKNHLSKFNISSNHVKFTRENLQHGNIEIPVLKSIVHFKPTQPPYYGGTIKIHAHFYGPYLIIQELFGNRQHVNSVIGNNLMNLITIDPIKAHTKSKEMEIKHAEDKERAGAIE